MPWTWQSTSLLDNLVDDDALCIILTSLSADDARSAFCVSRRWSSKSDLARSQRLKVYWVALFGSDLGFPDEQITWLSGADSLRFEARLSNQQELGRQRCLSCLKPSDRHFGEFCFDCIGDDGAFVHGSSELVSCSVTCGHRKLVYYCALCEVKSCRTCLMQGACTFCMLVAADAPAHWPCEL